MAWFDLDGFLASLADRGVPAAQVPLYREAATAVLAGAPGGRFTDDALDQALAREALAGASARRLANLRLVGGQMIEFVSGAAATIAGPGVGAGARQPAATGAGATNAPAGAVATAGAMTAPAMALATAGAAPLPLELDLAIDVPRRAAPPPSERARAALPALAPPLPGCICRQRHDVYLDDYWQGVGTFYLTTIGLVGGAVWRLAPRYTWLVATTAMLALGALIAALTVGWRCEDCRRWIAGRGLDPDQRAQARTRGGMFLVIAVVLALACAVSVQAFRTARARGPSASPGLSFD